MAQQIAEIERATQGSVDRIGIIGGIIQNVESVTAVISSAVKQQSAVTVETARIVEQASLVAREVAAQIVTISTEAIETGRRASEIRDGSSDIASKVDGLRSIVVARHPYFGGGRKPQEFRSQGNKPAKHAGSWR